MKKRGLGRGLSALLSNNNVEIDGNISKQDVKANNSKNLLGNENAISYLNIELLNTGKYQPRLSIDNSTIEELAQSIKSQGVMQPVIVRKDDNDKFEIIAGERRWRASRLAGLTHIPAIIKEVSDQDAMTIAIIENLQRTDLNIVEQALSITRLENEFQLTQQELSEIIGISRSSITNILRILKLPDQVIELLKKDLISFGHAKVILSLSTSDKQIMIANAIVSKSLNVRQTEALVANINKSKTQTPIVDPDLKNYINSLSEKIGALVDIKHNKNGKGKLIINYNSLEELQGVVKHLL